MVLDKDSALEIYCSFRNPSVFIDKSIESMFTVMENSIGLSRSHYDLCLSHFSEPRHRFLYKLFAHICLTHNAKSWRTYVDKHNYFRYQPISEYYFNTYSSSPFYYAYYLVNECLLQTKELVFNAPTNHPGFVVDVMVRTHHTSHKRGWYSLWQGYTEDSTCFKLEVYDTPSSPKLNLYTSSSTHYSEHHDLRHILMSKGDYPYQEYIGNTIVDLCIVKQCTIENFKIHDNQNLHYSDTIISTLNEAGLDFKTTDDPYVIHLERVDA